MFVRLAAAALTVTASAFLFAPAASAQEQAPFPPFGWITDDCTLHIDPDIPVTVYVESLSVEHVLTDYTASKPYTAADNHDVKFDLHNISALQTPGPHIVTAVIWWSLFPDERATIGGETTCVTTPPPTIIPPTTTVPSTTVPSTTTTTVAAIVPPVPQDTDHPTPPTTPAGTLASGGLPRTGSSSTGLIWAGITLVAAGVAVGRARGRAVR